MLFDAVSQVWGSVSWASHCDMTELDPDDVDNIKAVKAGLICRKEKYLWL